MLQTPTTNRGNEIKVTNIKVGNQNTIEARPKKKKSKPLKEEIPNLSKLGSGILSKVASSINRDSLVPYS